jgi:acyl dehydratase
MPVPARLDEYVKTEKQRNFSRDFLVGWEKYETWETAVVGKPTIAPDKFTVKEEDVIAYNLACGETDPLMIDADYARKHSPTGEVLQHPVFPIVLAFFCPGPSGVGTWIRTPGARNPYQRMEYFEPFRSGEEITATMTTSAKYVQRNKHYLQNQYEFHNQKGVLKVRYWCSLILPATADDVRRFATA